VKTTVLLFLTLVAAAPLPAGADEPLPSWNPGPTRDAIVDFVARVTAPGDDFVPPTERIAVFDNDGTLWAEQPVYVQALFVFDRVKQTAADHPDWTTTEPFASVLRGDTAGALGQGEHGLLQMLMATHAGMTTGEFTWTVTSWLRDARHPRTGRPYTEMVYQPMLELLDYLRENGFKTFIVTGGGVEFVRVFSEPVYGIPPEQVVGSSIKTRYEIRDGNPVLARIPEIDFVNDKAGKPVGIQTHIGQRPIAAFGNSDGDFEMLEWTAGGAGPRLCMLVHHTDAGREWAYDRDSAVGRLRRGLDEAPDRGWVLIDMARDWKIVFAGP